jgi:NADH dehydrogenase FAD-containing subunit
MCGTAEFVCGKVNLVTPAFVDVGYQRIRYDYLVVASGSKCASNLRPKSLTLAGRAGSVDLEAQQVMSSSVATVVVVGGGLTAVEYAAALKTHAPSKSVRQLCFLPRIAPLLPSSVSFSAPVSISSCFPALPSLTYGR